MSELSARQAAGLTRVVFRIRVMVGAVAAVTSALAVSAMAVVATDSPLASSERVAFAGLAGVLAYQLWLVGWSALLRRYPGLAMVLELVDQFDPRRRG
ncbi:MAG: hypothetical protein L0Y54_17705 [Sporichthyaceae bacterium]|nr:hypothetical protein [Sporichthyaceae bacterium]